MPKLDVAVYCEKCPYFKPVIDDDDIFYEFDTPIRIHDPIVLCENHNVCDRLYKIVMGVKYEKIHGR